MLQFGVRNPAIAYRRRAVAFGVAERDGLIACVRVARETGPYFDLPGGAVDGEETEAEALVREFREETGLAVQPLARIAEAGQYFVRSTGEALDNVGGYWIATVLAENPGDKREDDHALVWLEPAFALSRLRHDAHAWAIAVWMRR